MQIFVANIAYESSESEVRQLFEAHGEIFSLRLMKNPATNRLRGYGFVDMPRPAAERAVEALNGYELKGRKLAVKVSAPRRRQQENENQKLTEQKGEQENG